MTNPDRNVRLVVSGPGLIGRRHMELVRSSGSSELAAIVAPDKAVHSALAAELGVRRYDTVEAALDAEAVDGLIVASPNPLHLQQALAGIERKLPTLIEKPLAASLAEAQSIVSASQVSGAPVLVGHHRTYNPLLQAARTFLRSPQFGQPVAVQGSALFYKPDEYFAAAPWRSSKGGGPVLINLIHEVGVLRYLVGEVESVSATLSSGTRKFEVEDSAAVCLSFANGAVGTFLLSDAAASSKSWEMTTGENPAFPHYPDQNCYHFAGSMGSLDFPSMRWRTYLGEPSRSWSNPFVEGQIAVEAADPLVRQLEHFEDVIRGRAEPLVSAQDGYRNMLVVEGVMQAAASSRSVALAELGK